jgi:tape measure domain-containing protein
MAEKKVTIAIDIVQSGSGNAKVKSALDDIAKQAERANRETVEHAVRWAKQDTRNKEVEAKRQQKIVDDMLAHNIQKAKEETSRRAAEVAKITAQTKQQAAAQRSLNAQVGNEMIANDKRVLAAKRAFLRSIESASKDSARKMKSVFGDVFAGTFLGQSAYGALSAGLSKAFSGLQTAFQKSLDFSQMKTSLAQFEGSMTGAEMRIKSLMKVAQETPGLGFLSAIEGQKRLMAIGFEAEQATKILTGLAKVRVLSGASKDDFDAMLINLVQIANGGQKVTQELREMATRMPSIIQVIRKEFGTIGSELNDIDPKEFVARLADAMAKTQADAHGTTLAVENLQDAFDRLYIGIGSIIEQNPDVVAAIKTFTKEIDGNTDALSDNESQSRRTAGSWVSTFAKAAISAVNAMDTVSAAMWDAGLVAGKVALGIQAAWSQSVAGIKIAVNAVIDALNTAIGGYNRLPAPLKMGSMFSDIPEVPRFNPQGNLNDVQSAFNRMGIMDREQRNRRSAYDRTTSGRWESFEDEKLLAEFEQFKRRGRESGGYGFSNIRRRQRDRAALGGGVDGGGDSGGSGGGGRARP